MQSARSNFAGANLLDLLQSQLKIKQLEISSLLEITQAINNNLPAADLFRVYELTMLGQMKVQRLLLFSKNEGWEVVSSISADKNKHGIDVGTHLLQYDEITELDDESPAELQGFDIVIPVHHKKEPLAFALIKRPKTESYETIQEKISFIETYTNIIIVAIENKRLFQHQIEQERVKKELELAAQVQTLLIPDQLPKDDAIEMAAIYQPHRDIGGDYYDYLEVNEDEIVFCIADISGKGIAAALLMANFQAQLRAYLRQNYLPITDFIQQLNKNVNQITRGDKFITMFLAKYNKATRVLKYINAGHNPPVLLQNGKSQLLDKGCTILGMFEELPFVNMQEITLEKGALIVTYTDGVTDLENESGELFSTERIVDTVIKNGDIAVEELNHRIFDEVIYFKGANEFVDDISILSCRMF